MSEADTPTYIGRKACGCAVAAVIDDPGARRDPDTGHDPRREVANEVAKWIRRGLAVERTTVGAFRASPEPFGCQCPKPVQKTFDFRQSHAKATR